MEIELEEKGTLSSRSGAWYASLLERDLRLSWCEEEDEWNTERNRMVEKLPEIDKRKGWPIEVHTVGHAVCGLPGMKVCQLSCQDGSDETAHENIRKHVENNLYVEKS